MIRRRLSFHPALIAALLSPLAANDSARAQSVGRMALDDVTNAARDFGAIWVAPFRASGKDYLIAGGVLAGTAALLPLDDDIDRWAVRNRDRGVLDLAKPFRRGGDLYSLNTAAPYVGGLYLVGLATKSRGLRDGIFGCGAAYSANTIIRHYVVYRLVGRNRPDTLRNHPEGYVPVGAAEGDQYVFHIPAKGWGDHSFPGGHVATMATCASFLSHRFELGVAEPALAVLVAAMGVGRLADQGHWFTDQVVGVIYGYAVGREVARRQLRRLERERRSAAPAEATAGRDGPYIGADENGTRIGWQHSF
jgi:membrane-associated phospholipid phosphatase